MPTSKEYNQKYYQEHKEELKKSARDWYWAHREYCSQRAKRYHQRHRAENRECQRQTALTTTDGNGNALYLSGLNKRPHPDHCELCVVENIRLSYHHWDNSNYSKGIWLCYQCHVLVGMIDSGILVKDLIERYGELKHTVEIEFTIP